MAWCSDYLSNRFQRTLANNNISQLKPVTCGVPQGSILGPMLFLLYINDLGNALSKCKVQLYADDTIIYFSHKDVKVASSMVQSDLDCLSNWCNANQLTVNAQKTKAVYFDTKYRKDLLHTSACDGPPVWLKVQNESIEVVNHFCYLGIALDDLLTFEKHAKETIKLVAQKVSILAKLKAYLTSSQLLLLYKSKVLPYMDYGDIFVVNTYQRSLGKLQKQQNRALRICLGAGRLEHRIDLHKSAKMEFLGQRRNMHLLNYMYKRKSIQARRENNSMRTRLFDAVVVQNVKNVKKPVERSVYCAGATAWNSLPAAERNLPSYESIRLFQKRKVLAELMKMTVTPDC